MIQNIILYILSGFILSSIIYYIILRGYRKKMAIQLGEKQGLEKEKLLLVGEIQTLKERESIQAQNIAKSEEEYRERLKEQKDEHQRMISLQRESLTEQLKAMEAQFTSLSEEITRRRTDELSKQNKSSMDSIIQPLKETIVKLEKELKDNSMMSAERMGTLKEQITHLMDRTTEMGTKADNLSEALRMGGKRQGIWGETVLERLLQSEGLEKNIHYETQKYMVDNHKEYYLDVLLHLPENKAVVIDSKVSLKAYSDYHATKDEEEKELYLKEHIGSIKNHIKDLSSKEYHKLLDRNWASPDFVIMFVPIPGALQLALEHDSSLYDLAKKKGVYLSNTQSVLPILWIIKDLWSQSKQEKNVEEIVKHAENLLTRLNNFFIEFEKIQRNLEQAMKSYENADRKIRGRQGVLASATNIQDAGIKLTSKDMLPPLLSEETEINDPFE